MSKKAASALLKGLLAKAGDIMFRYQVKTGLILCAVPPGEGDGTGQGEDDSQNVETGEDTGTAAGNDDGQGLPADDTEEDVVVTIGEEAPPPEEDETKAPDWVRELRKNHRELVKRNRELEERLKATTATPAQAVPTVGPKPSLEACDYDAEAYETALAKWYEDKRLADDAKAKADAAAKAEQDAWNAKLNTYHEAKKQLKVKDFDDAEANVLSTFSKTQQGILMQGAEKPELLVYALGKSPQKLKELAAITDPVKYAFAVAKLETQLKVTPRKAPPPEKVVTGSAPVAGTTDSTLDRLRAEADKTGDRSKVAAYLRSKRQA